MKNILEVPSFDDAQQNATGRLIFLMSIGLVGASLLFLLVASVAFQALISRALLLAALIVPLCLITLWLLHNKKLNAAGILLIGVIWSTTTLGTITAGGISAPILMGYLFVIGLSGLVTERSVGIFTSVLSLVAAFIIAWLEMEGRLPRTISYSPLERAGIYGFFFIMVLILQIVIAGNTNILITRARNSENRYRSLLEKIPTISYINANDMSFATEYVSPQVQRFLGYTQSEFLQDPGLWIKLLHPEDKDRVLAEAASTVESGQPFILEYRLITRDGRTVWVRDEAILVADESSAPPYWLGVWTDITERKQAEEQQAELISVMTKRTIQLQTAADVSRAMTSILDINVLLPNVVELIRSHFDYYYVGIFLLDESQKWAQLRAGTGEMANTMLAQGFRLEVGDSSMIGWCISHRTARIALDVGVDAVQFRNPHLPLTRSEMALPLITHGDVIGAMTIQSVTPAAFSRVDITSLQSLADQVANAIENARLFSERAALIAELEGRNAELERFTYTVSHDLRSPLVTIRGFLGYLRHDAASQDLTRFDKDMARIANAVDRMQALLNDLLELSRVGRIINPPEELSLEAMVHETVNLLNSQLSTSGVRLKVQPSLPVVLCDRTRLIEVLQNLIGNAIKFMGPQQEPEVEVGTQGTDRDDKVIVFVRDNGIGIEPAYHERIFGLFNRLDPTIEGTGVGLTLVKRIIEVHGGRIWVESQAGAGSTFFFTLPLAQP